jgi:hypothetical protein
VSPPAGPSQYFAVKKIVVELTGGLITHDTTHTRTRMTQQAARAGLEVIAAVAAVGTPTRLQGA